MSKHTKIFSCIHCGGIYADEPVSQCDCLGGSREDHTQDFTEGVLIPIGEWQQVTADIKVLAEGMIEAHNKPIEYGPFADPYDTTICDCKRCQTARKYAGGKK